MVSLVSVGQYAGLRRFFGNPRAGIIGAVASVWASSCNSLLP